jgi:hypothetical protein
MRFSLASDPKYISGRTAELLAWVLGGLLLLTVVAVVAWWRWRRRKEREGFETASRLDRELGAYLATVHPDVFSLKLGERKLERKENQMDRDAFEALYRERVKPVPHELREALADHAAAARGLLASYAPAAEPLLQRASFRMTTRRLEGAMPFTLGETIFLPEPLLRGLPAAGAPLRQSVVETIVHEMAHLVQRANGRHFRDFYLEEFTFAQEEVPLAEAPAEVRRRYMTNPDSCGTLWTYNLDGQPKMMYVGVEEREPGQEGDPQFVTFAHSRKTGAHDRVKSLPGVGSRAGDWLFHPNEIAAVLLTRHIMGRSRERPDPETDLTRKVVSAFGSLA